MLINITVCPIFHLSITWTQSKDKNSLYATAPRWEDINFTYSDLDLCKSATPESSISPTVASPAPGTTKAHDLPLAAPLNHTTDGIKISPALETSDA